MLCHATAETMQLQNCLKLISFEKVNYTSFVDRGLTWRGNYIGNLQSFMCSNKIRSIFF